MKISEVFEFLFFLIHKSENSKISESFHFFQFLTVAVTLYPKTTKNELRQKLKDYKMV